MFTSPEPPTSAGLAGLPKNSEIIALKGFFITLHSTLRRPRCAMPTTTSSNPSWLPRFKICSKAGITDSAPSSPNLLVPTYFRARNFSKHSAAVIRSSIVLFPNMVKSVDFGSAHTVLYPCLLPGSCICKFPRLTHNMSFPRHA